MRNQRHKYVRHCATDCLDSHDRCGWHTHTTYPMKGALTAQEIYEWRNFKYWTTVNRWAWRGAYESEYTKWRISDNKYEFDK